MGKSLSLTILFTRCLSGCMFQPPAQSGSDNLSEAEVPRRPFRADQGRANYVVLKFFERLASILTKQNEKKANSTLCEVVLNFKTTI